MKELLYGKIHGGVSLAEREGGSGLSYWKTYPRNQSFTTEEGLHTHTKKRKKRGCVSVSNLSLRVERWRKSRQSVGNQPPNECL